MKERNFKNITFNRWGVSPKKNTRPLKSKSVYGFDTETFKGRVSLLGVKGDGDYSDYLIPDKPVEILEFLTQKRFRGSHNFFFNLKYDRDAILKCLPDRYIDFVKAYDQCFYRDFKIQLHGNKSFKISKLNRDRKPVKSALFTDISSFYHLGSLENTVKEALKLDYKKSLDIGAGVSKQNITQDHIDYCLEDCKYTFLLAKNIVDMADEFVEVRNYYTPASISKAFLRQNFPGGYEFNKTNIQQIALNCYNGGRFEILQKGWFDRVYSADINSAYPFQLSKLYEPRGTFLMRGDYEPDSLYSYFKVDVEVSEDFVLSPFKFCVKALNELLVFPTGVFKDVYINKREFEVLDKMGCRVKIKQGYHIFNKNPKLWIEGVVEMFYRRQELKELGDSREHLLKLILNSLYGITIQLTQSKKATTCFTDEDLVDPVNELVVLNNEVNLIKKFWRAGSWFNPIIACELTAGTRCKLFEDFHKYEDHIIMLATDSVTMDRRIPVKESRDLGGYKHSLKTRGLVLANGIYQFEDGKQGRRGLMSDRGVDLFDMFHACNKDRITLVKTRPKGLKEALPFDCDRPNAFINTFVEYPREVAVNMDRKRVWNRDFNTFREVLVDNIASNPLHYG